MHKVSVNTDFCTDDSTEQFKLHFTDSHVKKNNKKHEINRI